VAGDYLEAAGKLMAVAARTRPGIPIVIFVADSDMQIYTALSRAWDRIRTQAPDVPGVVFDLTPGRPSSCSSVGWRDSPSVVLVNLKQNGNADGPNVRGTELLAWLLHQAAHAITGPVRSQEGRFHTAAYRDAAVSLGLQADRDPTGYGTTSLAPGTKSRYRNELAALDRALAKWEPTSQVKAERSSRNGVVLACSCTPPRKVRMRGGPARIDASRIRCEICGDLFEAI
jgi:hypothetical protein